MKSGKKMNEKSKVLMEDDKLMGDDGGKRGIKIK